MLFGVLGVGDANPSGVLAVDTPPPRPRRLGALVVRRPRNANSKGSLLFSYNITEMGTLPLDVKATP